MALAQGFFDALGYATKRFTPKTPRDYLAGTDTQRVRALIRAWQEPKPGLVLAARGGFGASRLLAQLSPELFRKSDPKLLAGFSDISALLNWFADRVGLITFHAPNAATLAEANQATRRSFWHLLEGKAVPGDPLATGLKAARSGNAEGRLAGGNLVVLASLVGTSGQVTLTNKIAFFEDIYEEPYSLDRAFTQLAQGGGLGKAKAVVLASFHDRKGRLLPGARIARMVLEHLPSGVPVVWNLKVGHIGTNLTLPIGARVRLEGRKGRLVLLEKVVR